MTHQLKNPVEAKGSEVERNSHLYSIDKKYYRHTHKYLSALQVKEMYKSAETAYEIGCSLNRHFTIIFDDLADKKRPQKFVSRIMEHTRK